MNAPITVVTGAGQGVGRAAALRLAQAGHRVVLVGRDRQKLERVADEISTPALALSADLLESDQVDRVFGTVEDTWGPAQVLVASAGTSLAASVVDTTDQQWQQMLESNLTAPFRCIRRVLPAMLTARHGRIVVVASVVAKRGERGVSAYSASKHGVLGLVRAVADEVARSGVTANAVCPGYVDTPMTAATVTAMAARLGVDTTRALEMLERRQPIGRLIAADEVASAIMACVDNGAINGQGINVDGGTVQS